AREVATAVTQASTTGAKRRTSKSARTISRAKSDPASGAWKEAAIPAPAPAASRIEASRRGSASRRERDEATAPPRCTTGPSRPGAAAGAAPRARGQGLPPRPPAADGGVALVHRLDHLDDTVAAALRAEAHDQGGEERAERGPDHPRPARRLEQQLVQS